MATFANQGGVTTSPNGLPVDLVRSYVRLDGAVPGAAVETGPNVPMVVGDSVTIAGGFKAILWRFLRATEQDGGTVTIDGEPTWLAGSGPQYQTTGFALATNTNERWIEDLTASVAGTDIYIELLIGREAP